MSVLYIDCSMGAAGDMLSAALLELLPDQESFLDELNHLGIPGVQYIKESSVKCGITGTHMRVLVYGEEEEAALGHSHDEIHEHHHDHDHDHEHEHEHEHDHDHVHEHEHDHHHEHEHLHDHDHNHDHEHMHEHHHDHDHAHHHHHSSLHDIEHIVSQLSIPAAVRTDVLAVYGLIAEAESHAHGVPVTQIHFHEVGTMDAVADITAVCLLIHRLHPDTILASPIHVGSGQVRCAHGILPVPAPATAYILQDVPIYSGEIRGELCTPTGAALLKHFVSEFGPMKPMRTRAIGYGMGARDFESANCVRVMLGEAVESSGQKKAGGKTGQVLELSCNVDDMTAEEISYAMDRIFKAGAREVYTVPIGMKKSRPGVLLRVMCTPSYKDRILEAIFRYTTTIGVREVCTQRYVLDRYMEQRDTVYGPVHVKVSSGYGVSRKKYEFEDLARIASEQGMTLQEVRDFLDGTVSDQ